MSLIIVKAAYDPDARVWYVESSDLHGVNAEAATLEALADKLPGVVADLLEDRGEGEVPIELIAHVHTRAHVAA